MSASVSILSALITVQGLCFSPPFFYMLSTGYTLLTEFIQCSLYNPFDGGSQLGEILPLGDIGNVHSIFGFHS